MNLDADVRENDFVMGIVMSGPWFLLVILLAFAGLITSAFLLRHPESYILRLTTLLLIVVPLLLGAVFAYFRLANAYALYEVQYFRGFLGTVAPVRSLLLSVGLLSGCSFIIYIFVKIRIKQ